MEEIRVLLCCGAGLSSGFIAQRLRAEAKKKNRSLQVEARSEAQVGLYLNTIDVLLLGPHFANQLPNFEKLGKEHGFITAVIPQKIYGTMDAAALLDLILELIK